MVVQALRATWRVAAASDTGHLFSSYFDGETTKDSPGALRVGFSTLYIRL